MRALVRLTLALAALAAVAAPVATAQLVGRQADGSVLLPDAQVITPAGRQVELPLRPTGVAISPDGRYAAFHADGGGPALALVDLASGRIASSSDAGLSAASFDGLAFTPDGGRLLASAAGGALTASPVGPRGALGAATSIAISTDPAQVATCCNPYPGGIAPSPDGRTALVTLSRENELAVADLTAGTITKRIRVGNAPHSVLLADGLAYVSNEGGRPAQPGDTTQRSAGTPIVADPFTGAAVTGTVSVVDPAAGTEVATIPVGLHPTALARDGDRLYVANTDSDSVSIVDLAKRAVVATFSAKPFAGAAPGSFPNGLAVLPNHRLAVTLGRANAVALFDVADAEHARLEGLIPTAWYPTGVAFDAPRNRLVVANQWGAGSLVDADAGRPARGVGGAHGTVSLVKLPDARQLKVSTRTALQRVKPAPEAEGIPPAITHVVYVIKENRTYDQIMGDDARGNGDPGLVLWGKSITPNLHKLATAFPLLDNFYVSGRRSNDGHQWVTRATNPDYLEKASGNDQRSDYAAFGSPPSSGFDALLYSQSGFIWENALRHGRTVEDFGEYTIEENPPPARSDVPSLAPFVVPEYQGFNLQTPDQTRADIFKRHLAAHEAAGDFPSLTMVLLPNDHTGGSNPLYLSPESQLADNDAATGQIVDAVSHSSFWPHTAIFVVEDDAQGGVDHVDGHRSPAFVISPYARRGIVDSTFATQVNMVRTIEQILGLPPMNPLDSAAAPMRSVFTDTPDLTPYDAVPAQVSTTAPNPPLSALEGRRLAWAKAISREDFTHLDAPNEQLLNRDIWYSMRGYEEPYPGDGRVLWPSEVPAGDGED